MEENSIQKSQATKRIPTEGRDSSQAKECLKNSYSKDFKIAA